VMNGLDVFVLSSHSEPFGIVVLEAMASGCGIVATDAGGVPDIIRDEQDGLLTPSRNPEEMARDIRELLDDHALLKSLRDAALGRVTREFPLWRHVARMREIYEALHGE